MPRFLRRTAALVAAGALCGASYKASASHHTRRQQSPNGGAIRRFGAAFRRPAAAVAFAQQQQEAEVVGVPAGHRREDLPDIDLDTIAAHCGKSSKNKKTSSSSNISATDSGANVLEGYGPDRIFVTYKAGVYDITEFIEQHPGGRKRIMLAAGGSIERFWQQVTIHNDDAVRTILESMRIGNVKGYDPTKKNGGLGGGGVGSSAAEGEDDEMARLWGSEPRRAAALDVIAARPFNAQAPDTALDTFLTPNELFFVRNHMPVPLIAEETVEVGTTPTSATVNSESPTDVAQSPAARAAAASAARARGIERQREEKEATHSDNEDGIEITSEGAAASDDVSAPTRPFCLQVEGIGVAAHCFTLPELRALFKRHAVATTIECGGNRRTEMTPVAESLGKTAVKGLPWTNGAISTAEWGGFLLADIVDHCRSVKRAEEAAEKAVKAESLPVSHTNEGENTDTSSEPATEPVTVVPTANSSVIAPTHVQFQGADGDVAGHFAVSVPVGLALGAADRPTLVASTMNGEPIPRDHGYPLRAIVPGTVGVRNCKWLARVTLAAEEAQTVWQQHDYKNFPVYSTKPDPSLPSVYAMPITSAVTDAEIDANGGDGESVTVEVPLSAVTTNEGAPALTSSTSASATVRRTTISPTRVIVKGYAYTGSGAGVQRVELSADGGTHFTQSALLYKHDHPIDVVAAAELAANDGGEEDAPPRATLGLSTGLSNITADGQFNVVKSAAAGNAEEEGGAAAAQQHSSVGMGAPSGRDWTWSLFSAVVDVTNAAPSRFVAVPMPTEGEGDAASSSDSQPASESEAAAVAATTPAAEANESVRYLPCWRICSRAVGADNAMQPPLGTYNFRGLLYNGYSCREVCKEDDL